MIRSIALQNFKSFGEPQTIPLEPVTVLVGPNNSGKSNFMSVGRFLQNVPRSSVRDAIHAEGGDSLITHRPPWGDGSIVLGWTSDDASPQTLRISSPDRS